MTEKTVAQKMRIKDGARVAVLHDPSGVSAGMGFGPGTTFTHAVPDADVVLLFVTTQAEFEERFASLLPDITRAMNFWVVYPKGAKAAGRSISRDTIWPVAEASGFRPVGIVSVDDTWAGFRLRPAEQERSA